MDVAQMPIEHYREICNAVRNKTGKTEPIKSGDMPSEILSIKGGGTPFSYNQVNGVVNDYLTQVDYTDVPYTQSSARPYYTRETTYRKDYPYSETLANGNVCLSDAITHRCYKQNNIDTANVVNGGYSILTDDNELLDSGSILTTGALRMIKTDTLENVRDIGGWNCDNGTVKYGLVYRGSRFVDGNGKIINEADEKLIKEFLGVECEVDYQLVTEGGGTNPLSLKNYISIPTPYIVGSDTYEYLVTTQKAKIVLGVSTIMQNVVDNKATYIHCTHGADRTGVTCWILEQILGMSQSDIDKDYEITSFAGSSMYRLRNQERYTALIDYMSALNGEDMQHKVAKWLVSNGVSLTLINDYRRAIIDGNPQDIELDVYTNQIPNSECPYPSTNGIMFGYRYSSSGVLEEQGTRPNNATGYITVANGDVIRMSVGSFTNEGAYAASYYVYLFDENKTVLGRINAQNIVTESAFTDVEWNGTSLTKLTVNNANAKYIAVCNLSIDNTSILTLNEEIL